MSCPLVSASAKRRMDHEDITDMCFSILCGDLAIKQIEEPFVDDADNAEEWAI